MCGAGHEPSEALLVKMTDGRIRMLPGDGISDRLRRLENEVGPIAVAYLLTRGGAVVEIQPPARDSSSSAIFAASLGMVTGALPKDGLRMEPSGLVKSPV